MSAKNKKVNIEEVWFRAKRNFIIGKDYIESEANDEYIVFSVLIMLYYLILKKN